MSNTADLRAALDAALSDLTDDQAQAAHALIGALTPAMEEPKWPGAPVIAACSGDTRRSLHVRHNDGQASQWEGEHCCYFVKWDQLINPRPLTLDEYAEHGIPAPCTHGAQDSCGVGQVTADPRRETPIPTPPKGDHPRQGMSGRAAKRGCPGCGDPKDHDGLAGQRFACVSMAWERTWAIEWLAGATGMPAAEAERAVDAMGRTAGIRAGVRVLDALLDLGWRPGGGR